MARVCRTEFGLHFARVENMTSKVNKTDSVRINVTLRSVSVKIVVVKKQ